MASATTDWTTKGRRVRRFRDTPIQRKLIAISLLSSGVALLLAGASFLTYELVSYRKTALNKLESVAGVIAANSAAALIFDDPRAAETTLSALRSERPIVTACIYAVDGALFAAYYRDDDVRSCPEWHGEGTERAAEGNTIAFSLPIVEGDEAIGSIAIFSQQVELYWTLSRYAAIVGLVMLAAGLASLPLARYLQRFISGPILRLVDTAKHISEAKDYSVRAVSEGGDELGVLVGAFNEMLEQIENRDAKLAVHRHNLEEEVQGRTAELKSANQELMSEISHRKRAEERIRHLAYYDDLTGLPNRQLFREQLQGALKSAQHRGHQVGLIFLDLDRFKQVNDTLGHSVGDELLCEVSNRLLQCVRFNDYVGRAEAQPKDEISRLGGDEFTVLLTKISDPHDAAKVAERVLEALSRPIPASGYELFTSASIGIAIYPHDGEDMETLLRNADTAMYHAKSQHRNNFQFYNEAMNATAMRKMHLAGRLRHAMDRHELLLYYQPLRQAVSGELSGAEALLRWTDPELGPVSPEEFIPIAEDMGLILAIGEWVLRTACAQAMVWQNDGFREIRMAVNVSTHQLRHAGWSETVAQILEETGLSPAYLELEMTESAILQNDDATIEALRALDDMGVSMALDDFGTGYSSLSYLRRFPFDRLKIDRSFVCDIINNPDDAALTTAILAMAQSLQLRVVAEGVETQEQAEFLRDRGCDELQGFLFSRAVPASDFVRFLDRHKEQT